MDLDLPQWTTMRLEQTCYACPEQYDVYHGKLLVGYLRLRHGYFTAKYPNVGGDVVYESETHGDGVFDDDERVFHLGRAEIGIRKAMEGDGRREHR